MNICLIPMTWELAKTYFQEFENDPNMFPEYQSFVEYRYTEEKVRQYLTRQSSLGRVHFAILSNGEPVGEIILKSIDHAAHHCTMGIHLQNDSRKNRGIGTQAERLALEYAFNVLNMDTVYADALQKNRRSQHVLEKVGFIQTHQDPDFRYYRCDKSREA